MSSSKPSSKEIKDTLINVIYKTAEKSVSQGKYDKTILATIQYCVDKTNGQYRIKYQNGYYTAYGSNQDYIYSDGSTVFVLVPQSDFTNKLFITGSASNYNNDKVYLTNLEDEQKYKTIGPNILTKASNRDLHLSSYDNKDKPYYIDGADDNIFVLNEDAFNNLKTSKYFKLGVNFRTELTEDRKTSGDYGIRIIATFQNEKETYDKVYELNTFMMSGSPFNFTQYVPQVAYWSLEDAEGQLVKIKEIQGFTRLFPQGTQQDSDFRDIFVDNITLQAAQLLYNVSNNIYRVGIDSPDSFKFDTTKDYVTLVGSLYIYGNLVQDVNSGMEYYWGKRDATVDNVNNPHYCEQLGKGWYCFNNSSLIRSEAATAEALKTESLVTLTPIQADDYTKEEIAYVTNEKEIVLSKALCQAKETEIICAIVYNGTTYYSDITKVKNPAGYYLLIGAQNDIKVHYNGLGYFTIAAGVFRDIDGQERPDDTLVLNDSITYKWTEYKDGIITELPVKVPDQILLSNPEWSPTKEVGGQIQNQDNEFLTDTEVAEYIGSGDNLNVSLAYCIERYNYYKVAADRYSAIPQRERTQEDNDYLDRCIARRDGIITGKLTYINTNFDDDYVNELGYYIFGPSDVTAKYLADGQQDYVNAEIDSISPRDDGSGTGINVYNTLYKIPANKIGTTATYEVSATITNLTGTYGLGSQLITLTNDIGSTLDYTVEITNGQQTFVYDERGISPTSESAIQKIALQPLSFILRNKEGEVLYNSANPDDSDIDIAELQPMWTFADSKYSFIQTNYQKPVDTPTTEGTPNYAEKAADFETTHMWELHDDAYFYYNLRENYNNNYANSSNVGLRLFYDGAYVFGSTVFTFTKQGDLGTNGTNKSLGIYSNTYNNYKNAVLSDFKYCRFNTESLESLPNYDNNARYYGPDERHLGKPYLFATNSYDSLTRVGDTLTPCSLLDGWYVNLYLAQQPYNDGEGISHTDSGSYQVRWSRMTTDDTALNQTQWSIPNVGYTPVGWTTINGERYYYEPNISLSGDSGVSVIAQITRVNEDPVLSYRPSPFTFSRDGQTGTHISNNIISANAKTTLNESSKEIKTYAYCTLPYYYINWTYYDSSLSGEDKLMPNYVDPARHIIIVGGFDQVVYNGDGKNPYYNGEPFKFYMFDKEGEDITYEVAKAAKDGLATIQWDCSAGFKKNSKTIDELDNIKDFTSETYPDIINEGMLCKYNNKYYKCIQDHQKSISHVVNITIFNSINTLAQYPANAFVPAYWEETDVYTYYQSMSFVPDPTYESLTERDLFNSWIKLYIRYYEYEAEVFLPINVYCNSYESPELNSWDGKSLVLEDGDDTSYLIANKVSAGIKDDQNQFIGISIGENIRYTNSNGERQPSHAVGLFGFGYGSTGSTRSKQTLFLDAQTGRAAFGPSGSTQIILDPDPDKWSRLGGWYFSQNYLYKPVNETAAIKYSDIMYSDNMIAPPEHVNQSFGIYVPANQEVDSNTIAMWAGTGSIQGVDDTPVDTAPFYVTYGGHLHASDIDVQGRIVATEGSFGTGTDKIDINVTDSTTQDHYILKHENFWVKDSEAGSEVGIKGRILAKSGQIGDLSDSVDGNSINTTFLNYEWYPWHLPGPTQPWNNSTYYLDTSQGKNTSYILYHKNFSIGTDGMVRMNGKIYVEEGRIGSWVIDNGSLKTVDSNVVLNGNGNASFGALTISNAGAISGTNWSIAADGTANFTNAGNIFKAQDIQTTQMTAGGSRFDSSGNLTIPVGGYLDIGGSAKLTANSAAAFTFEGGIGTFSTNAFILNATIQGIAPSKTFRFDATSGGDYIANDGIYFNSGTYHIKSTGVGTLASLKIGTTNNYYWDNSGNIYVNTLHVSDTINGINIGNMTLAQYIQNLLNNYFNTKTRSRLNDLASDAYVVTDVSHS